MKINELQELGRKTRNMLTVQNAFHRKGYVGRLYIKRSEGGVGLFSVEDCVLIEKNCLLECVRTNSETVLKEVKRETILEPGEDKKTMKENRKSNLKNEILQQN